MSADLIIFPFGGNAREALMAINATNKIIKKWNIIGFIDDDSSTWGRQCCGVKVIGGKDVLNKQINSYVLAVPGNSDNYLKRKEIIESLGLKRERFPTIIDPSAVISDDSTIGYNTIIMPNSVVSCGVEIGNHCVVLPNSVISHDCKIGDYCCIGSNVSISGNVIIGSNCYIGSGVNIREKLIINTRTLVGLGSNVVCDIEEGAVVAGNPARLIRRVEKI